MAHVIDDQDYKVITCPYCHKKIAYNDVEDVWHGKMECPACGEMLRIKPWRAFEFPESFELVELNGDNEYDIQNTLNRLKEEVKRDPCEELHFIQDGHCFALAWYNEGENLYEIYVMSTYYQSEVLRDEL